MSTKKFKFFISDYNYKNHFIGDVYEHFIYLLFIIFFSLPYKLWTELLFLNLLVKKDRATSK